MGTLPYYFVENIENYCDKIYKCNYSRLTSKLMVWLDSEGDLSYRFLQ